MTINCHGGYAAGDVHRGGRDAGRVARQDLRGTIQNDILKEYVARGTYIFPPTAVHAPDHRYLRSTARTERAAAGTPSASAAITSARRVPRRCRRWPSPWRTPSPTSRRPSRPVWRWTTSPRRLSFFFNAHNNFLEEVAKFRAARRLWARSCASASAPRTPSLDAALPHPDRRLDAHRAAAGEQRGARHRAGPGGGAGRDAVAAHQQHGRGAVAAHRKGGAGGAAHPADHRARERRR